MEPGASTSQALDVDHLFRQTFGDRTLERELLGLFQQQCLCLLPLISGAGAASTRVEAAHTLKGSARAVGAIRIAELVDRLECALEDGRSAATLERLSAKLACAMEEAGLAITVHLQRQAAA